jgi:hypothetical protein
MFGQLRHRRHVRLDGARRIIANPTAHGVCLLRRPSTNLRAFPPSQGQGWRRGYSAESPRPPAVFPASSLGPSPSGRGGTRLFRAKTPHS